MWAPSCRLARSEFVSAGRPLEPPYRDGRWRRADHCGRPGLTPEQLRQPAKNDEACDWCFGSDAWSLSASFRGAPLRESGIHTPNRGCGFRALGPRNGGNNCQRQNTSYSVHYGVSKPWRVRARNRYCRSRCCSRRPAEKSPDKPVEPGRRCQSGQTGRTRRFYTGKTGRPHTTDR